MRVETNIDKFILSCIPSIQTWIDGIHALVASLRLNQDNENHLADRLESTCHSQRRQTE